MSSWWKEASISNCCYQCKERFPACHDVCATYLQAKEEWAAEKERIKEARQRVRNYDDYHLERVKTTKKLNISKGKRY